MEKLHIVKIGGNIIDNEESLKAFLKDFSNISGNKILVHGGGKSASKLSLQMGVTPKMIEGRRVTNAETLRIVTMMYAGWVSKSIVAQLQAYNINAIGVSGADLNLIYAELRPKEPIDFGYVGNIKSVNLSMLTLLLSASVTPVFCALTHDKEGNLLNTNADTIAAELSIATSKQYDVSLVYCFEKKGVLQNPEDDESVIPLIDQDYYQLLKSNGIISAGMLPKMHNCFQALEKGVKEVKIMNAANLKTLNTSQFIGSKLVLKSI
ncbi:MAG: acetylglutamate kinase [Bacteroidota bacterium]